MNYAYYLAEKDISNILSEGDKPIRKAFSDTKELRDKWIALGLDPHSRYDGISRLPATVERGAVFRIMARDIFSEKFKMFTIDRQTEES